MNTLFKLHCMAVADDGSLVLWELSSPEKRTFPIVQQHHKNTKLFTKLDSFVGHGGCGFFLACIR